MDAAIPRVLIRIIRSPHSQRGELLAVYVDTRTLANPDVLLYSITKDDWRVEHHRHLMWRSRRANPHERAIALEAFTQMGERVRILQAAPRAMDPYTADEVPARASIDQNDGT